MPTTLPIDFETRSSPSPIGAKDPTSKSPQQPSALPMPRWCYQVSATARRRCAVAQPDGGAPRSPGSSGEVFEEHDPEESSIGVCDHAGRKVRLAQPLGQLARAGVGANR